MNRTFIVYNDGIKIEVFENVYKNYIWHKSYKKIACYNIKKLYLEREVGNEN